MATYPLLYSCTVTLTVNINNNAINPHVIKSYMRSLQHCGMHCQFLHWGFLLPREDVFVDVISVLKNIEM